MILNTVIWEHSFFKSKDKFKYGKFSLDIGGDFFSVLGFLIYLEIIVLKFCKYDYNIKENIARRSFKESYGINKKGINDVEDQNDNDNIHVDKSFASEEVEQEDDNLDLIYNNNN